MAEPLQPPVQWLSAECCSWVPATQWAPVQRPAICCWPLPCVSSPGGTSRPRRQDVVEPRGLRGVPLKVWITQSIVVINAGDLEAIARLEDQFDGGLRVSGRRADCILEHVRVIGDAVDGENLISFSDACLACRTVPNDLADDSLHGLFLVIQLNPDREGEVDALALLLGPRQKITQRIGVHQLVAAAAQSIERRRFAD